MSGPPTLSIIIVSYNAGSFLPDCLASISRRPPPFALEIIVVDNASTDGTRESAERHQMRYIYEPTLGLSQARNTGWKNAQHEQYSVSH